MGSSLGARRPACEPGRRGAWLRGVPPPVPPRGNEEPLPSERQRASTGQRGPAPARVPHARAPRAPRGGSGPTPAAAEPRPPARSLRRRHLVVPTPVRDGRRGREPGGGDRGVVPAEVEPGSRGPPDELTGCRAVAVRLRIGQAAGARAPANAPPGGCLEVAPGPSRGDWCAHARGWKALVQRLETPSV